MSDIIITPNRGSSNAPTIQFSGSVNASSSIRLEVLPEGQVAFLGKSGSLFSIADSMIGSLMAVSDISGFPILEVFSDDKVIMGKYNTNTLVVTGSRIGVGKSNPSVALDVSGSMTVTGSALITGTLGVTGTTTVSAVSATGVISTSATEALRINNDNAYISFFNTAGSTRTAYIQGASAGSFTFAAENGAAILLNTNSSTRMYINNSGNIGIGKTTPNSVLDVNGNTIVTGSLATTGAATFAGAVTAPSLSSPAATNLTLAGGSTGASLVLGATTGGVTQFYNGGAVQSMRIDQANRVIIGTGGVLQGDKMEIQGVDGTAAQSIWRFSADAAGPSLTLRKSRGATIAAQGLVSSGDTIGNLLFMASDGVASRNAAQIVAEVDGTAAASSMPGRLVFRTTPTGSVSLATAATLTSTGNLLIGTTDETGLTGAGGLKINSSTAGSSGAGALVVAGGLSAAGASYFGGAVTVGGVISSTGKTTVTNGNIRLSNAFYLSGNLAAGTEITMIGRRTDDKIAIDPDGYGVVFGGGAATFAGTVTAGAVTAPSLSSPAATNLTLGTGTYGTALTVASATGNIGIGKTTPNSVLDVNGNTIVTGSATITTSLGVGTAASGTAGEIRATNNVTAYYSDDRLKNNLGNIPDSLNKVLSLNGFYFEANETAQNLGYTKQKEVGVSAQQVQAILPEIIAPAPIDPIYMTVRYEKLIPLLIEAIKEQNSMIVDLQQRINRL